MASGTVCFGTGQGLGPCLCADSSPLPSTREVHPKPSAEVVGEGGAVAASDPEDPQLLRLMRLQAEVTQAVRDEGQRLQQVLGTQIAGWTSRLDLQVEMLKAAVRDASEQSGNARHAGRVRTASPRHEVSAGAVSSHTSFVNDDDQSALATSFSSGAVFPGSEKSVPVVEGAEGSCGAIRAMSSAPEDILGHSSKQALFTGTVPGRSSDGIRDGIRASIRSGLAKLNLGGMTGLEPDERSVENGHLAGAKCGSLHRLCEAIESQSLFHVVCSTVILANAIFFVMVAEAELNGSVTDGVFAWVELFFVVFYSLELLVRLGADRCGRFCYAPGCGWNWFDMLLVLSAWQEQFAVLVNSPSSGTNVSYLRTVRFLKLVKLLRVIRLMRAFRELRLVLNSIISSMKVMIWSIMLIGMMSFMFSVCFVQGVVTYVQDGQGVPGDGSVMMNYWGSVGISMVTLFKATTGGVDWEDCAAPLLDIDGAFYALFFMYIGVSVFMVTNLLTSIFVDSVREHAEKDQATVIQHQLKLKKAYMQKINALFKTMANDGSGEVSYEKFLKHMSDPRLVAFAASIEIEPTDLEQFFAILSAAGKRKVDLETFVVGCIKLRGMAKSMDLMDLLISQRRAQDEQMKFRAFVAERLDNMMHLLQFETTGLERDLSPAEPGHQLGDCALVDVAAKETAGEDPVNILEKSPVPLGEVPKVAAVTSTV